MLSVLYATIASEMLAINAFVVPLVGEEHVRRNDPPPRLIVYPTDESFGPPEGPGGVSRPLLTIVSNSEVVIHGAERDHVEGIRDQFLIALHKATKKATSGGVRGGRYVVGKGTWTRNTLIVKNGFEYRLTFGYARPVVDRVWEASEAPQTPDASTYTGDQANTYAVVPGDEVTISATVELVTP